MATLKLKAPRDPHNHAPDKSDTALLLIDVINDLEFNGGDDLLRHAMPMAHKLAALKERAKKAKVPVIYANDNFGRWQSDFRRLVDSCLESGVRGRDMVKMLEPADDDYFILKPKHSAFYQTNLDILLRYLGTQRLIVTGVAGDICVLFTANDAYMRDFDVVVPSDCIASESARNNRIALELMERVVKARVVRSTAIRFSRR